MSKRTGWAVAAALAVGIAMASGPALAMGSSDPPPKTAVDPNYTEAVKKIEAKDYKAAIALLEKAVAANASYADAFNYLGYANRNIGEKDKALAYYKKALEIDPKHKGAHEYVGELYLMLNNLPMAEQHLAQLSRICGPSCEEYRDLKENVDAYKAGKPKS